VKKLYAEKVSDASVAGSLMYDTRAQVRKVRQAMGLVSEYNNVRCVVKKVILKTRIVSGKVEVVQAEVIDEFEDEHPRVLGKGKLLGDDLSRRKPGPPRPPPPPPLTPEQEFKDELTRLRRKVIGNEFEQEAKMFAAMVV